jgi:hypothetical protein
VTQTQKADLKPFFTILGTNQRALRNKVLRALSPYHEILVLLFHGARVSGCNLFFVMEEFDLVQPLLY